MSFGGLMTPGVKMLLILNLAFFVLRFLAYMLADADPFIYLGLRPRAVLQVWGVYQLATYMFIHSLGIGHILFNMLILWMFGRDIERTWGTRRFLQYYFVCGVGAGICIVIGNILYGTIDTRTIGASGAVFGILLAYGMLFPDATVLFSFLFPMKAKYFVMIIGAIAFLSTLGASGSGVSHVAHLGGMVFGYFYIKGGLSRIDLTASAQRSYEDWKLQRAKKKFQVYLRKKKSDNDRWVH